MSYADAIARVVELDRLVQLSVGPLTPSSPARSSFAATLDAAMSGVAPAGTPGGVPPVTAAPANEVVGRLLTVAASQVGQAESPPGSNNGPAIARYRSATAGAYHGAPWCAYFASWVAQQAGVPLGESGQGYDAVKDVHDWAVRSGRLLAPGAPVRPGDLMLDGNDHMGIVERVNPDGSLETIEGNYSDRVARVHRTVGAETSFVRLAG